MRTWQKNRRCAPPGRIVERTGEQNVDFPVRQAAREILDGIMVVSQERIVRAGEEILRTAWAARRAQDIKDTSARAHRGGADEYTVVGSLDGLVLQAEK